MADDRFPPGALVQHTSGGPTMTIVRYGDYDGDRKAYCRWFDGQGELREAFFFDAELRTYQPTVPRSGP